MAFYPKLSMIILEPNASKCTPGSLYLHSMEVAKNNAGQAYILYGRHFVRTYRLSWIFFRTTSLQVGLELGLGLSFIPVAFYPKLILMYPKLLLIILEPSSSISVWSLFTEYKIGQKQCRAGMIFNMVDLLPTLIVSAGFFSGQRPYRSAKGWG